MEKDDSNRKAVLKAMVDLQAAVDPDTKLPLLATRLAISKASGLPRIAVEEVLQALVSEGLVHIAVAGVYELESPPPGALNH